MLTTLLVYAAIIRHRALAFENVRDFATMEQGRYVHQLSAALTSLHPAYRLHCETVCLREVHPIKRARWLAFCARQSDWLTLTPQERYNILSATWRPTSVGIPHNTIEDASLQIPGPRLLRYQALAYLPNGFHSRYIQDWEAIPVWTHAPGNEFEACPCGCRGHGLSDKRLRSKGIFATLVRSPHGARFPSPIELAQVMGFPRHHTSPHVAGNQCQARNGTDRQLHQPTACCEGHGEGLHA